jgi:hypothetical protein
MLMSDAGTSLDVNGATLVFSDCALRVVPNSSQIVTGRFRPSNYLSDTIIALAPDDSATTLAVFNGLGGASVNGTWNLFVSDDAAGDLGSISGWNITIFTDAGGLPAGLNPVPCGKPDFDGDGRADTVVYQSNGNWHVVGSGVGFFNAALGFGGAGFTAVAGDYDENGITDPAVYQASTRNWFVIGSTQGFVNAALNFGGPGFTPVPGIMTATEKPTWPRTSRAPATGLCSDQRTDFQSCARLWRAGFTPAPATQ